MRAYMNGGYSWRMWKDPEKLAPGEVFFDHAPTDDEIKAVFPGYKPGLDDLQIIEEIFWVTATLEEAQDYAAGKLLANMNSFREYKPDGSTRYDQNFEIVALGYAIKHGMAADPTPALDAWKLALGTFYGETMTAIKACTSVAEIQLIDISIASFESKFGVAGTVSPDPNIATTQLLT